MPDRLSTVLQLFNTFGPPGRVQQDLQEAQLARLLEDNQFAADTRGLRQRGIEAGVNQTLGQTAATRSATELAEARAPVVRENIAAQTRGLLASTDRADELHPFDVESARAKAALASLGAEEQVANAPLRNEILEAQLANLLSTDVSNRVGAVTALNRAASDAAILQNPSNPTTGNALARLLQVLAPELSDPLQELSSTTTDPQSQLLEALRALGIEEVEQLIQ